MSKHKVLCEETSNGGSNCAANKKYDSCVRASNAQNVDCDECGVEVNAGYGQDDKPDGGNYHC
jgi:hypothetical protein